MGEEATLLRWCFGCCRQVDQVYLTHLILRVMVNARKLLIRDYFSWVALFHSRLILPIGHVLDGVVALKDE